MSGARRAYLVVILLLGGGALLGGSSWTVLPVLAVTYLLTAWLL